MVIGPTNHRQGFARGDEQAEHTNIQRAMQHVSNKAQKDVGTFDGSVGSTLGATPGVRLSVLGTLESKGRYWKSASELKL